MSPLRKLKDYKLHYEKIYPHENSKKATIRLRRLFDSCIVVTDVQRYTGNMGFIELFPSVPKDLVIKVEGPVGILEEIRFNLLNGICKDEEEEVSL